MNKAFPTTPLTGLQTRPGRCRKPIKDCLDNEVVRAFIEQNRQSVGQSQGCMAGSHREKG